MSDWPAPKLQRADIVILRAPEAWRNYCLCLSMAQGYRRHRNWPEWARHDNAARISLDVYFDRLEVDMPGKVK